MGKKAVKEYFKVLMLAATFVLFIFTLIGLYGGDVTPVGHKMRALTTVVLPVLIPLNILTLIYWGVQRSWFTSIPLLALLASLNYSATIFQFGGKPENVPSQINVASYNVHLFNKDQSGVVASDVFNSLIKEQTQIICLQEFDETMGGNQSGISERLKALYPHKAQYHDLVIYSSFPIIKSKKIDFEMTNNGAMWADIKVDEKHTVRVYNVHMETTGINRALSHATTMESQEPELALARNVFDNYTFNCDVRSGQAITVANDKNNTDTPIILCGDFNDVPYSFTYNTLLGNLKDGFREGGHGWGATYRGARGLFRIDYIFHSDVMESLDYYTIDQDYSDHNPVYSKLKFK